MSGHVNGNSVVDVSVMGNMSSSDLGACIGASVTQPSARPLRFLWWNVSRLTNTGHHDEVIRKLNLH